MGRLKCGNGTRVVRMLEKRLEMRSLRGLAWSLGGLETVSEWQLQPLRGRCPANPDLADHVCLNQTNRDAILCLGIFAVQARDPKPLQAIVPYLIDVMRYLNHMRWLETFRDAKKSHRIPIFERYSFCLHTILSDIAALHPEWRDAVLQAQLDVMEQLCVQLVEARNPAQPLDLKAKLRLMRSVCLLLGLLRALARYPVSASQALSAQLIPAPFFSPPEPSSAPHNRLRSPLLNTQVSDPFGAPILDPLPDYFFTRHGSSFFSTRPLSTLALSHALVQLSESHLNRILAQMKQILQLPLLEALDNHATDVFASGEMKAFGYKTVSEVLSLVGVLLLRDALAPHSADVGTGLEDGFVRDVEEVVKGVFTQGQEELWRKVGAVGGVEKGGAGEASVVNKYRLMVQTNAACLQVLVWAANDESDADALCGRISEKLGSSHGHRHVLSHMPRLVVGMEALGKLAEKFPRVATTAVVPALRDFLLKPSPILTRLALRDDSVGGGDWTPSTPEPQLQTQAPVGKRAAAFARIRSVAINSLCRGLKAGLRVDPEAVQACLASVSTRLYVAEQTAAVSSLVCENGIAALGGIGVALKDVAGTPEAVLQVFQQRFAQPPSSLDAHIVAQLAQMLIAGTNSIWDEVMNMFNTITVESASTIYPSTPEPAKHSYRYSHPLIFPRPPSTRLPSQLSRP